MVCSNIRATLQRHCAQAEAALETAGELSEDLMRKYRIGETGGPHLFDFVINPFSFAQTVENIFYISFLIKEGKFGVQDDDDGLPTLCKSKDTLDLCQLVLTMLFRSDGAPNVGRST